MPYYHDDAFVPPNWSSKEQARQQRRQYQHQQRGPPPLALGADSRQHHAQALVLETLLQEVSPRVEHLVLEPVGAHPTPEGLHCRGRDPMQKILHAVEVLGCVGGVVMGARHREHGGQRLHQMPLLGLAQSSSEVGLEPGACGRPAKEVQVAGRYGRGVGWRRIIKNRVQRLQVGDIGAVWW